MNEPQYFAIRQYRKEVPEKFLGYPTISTRDAFICEQIIGRAHRVLEIGAGDRPFHTELKTRGFAGLFKTMDVDRTLPFDYYSIDEIAETFDAVIMREVIEHLPRPVLYAYLEHIKKILEPTGLLLITTPNPWAITWVFADYTHISPWPPADLYGVLRWYGFDPINIYRILWPSKALWLKRLYWSLHSRLYDIDFAGSYLAVATLSRRCGSPCASAKTSTGAKC
jgi:SAM-dependent methyltransferase